METIEVTARFDVDGRVTPLSFQWQGQVITVTSTGRRWNDGDQLHVLVMGPGDQVYELVFAPALSRWFLGKFPGHRQAA